MVKRKFSECNASNRYLCDESECNTCYEKSFAHHHPEKSLEWSSRNALKPYQVTKSIRKKLWFDCSICGHEYQMSLNNINKGRGCKYCNGKYLCEKLDCMVCHKKTFAFLSPEKSKFWSEKNEKGPDRVFNNCLLYTSPSPRDQRGSRMPSSA